MSKKYLTNPDDIIKLNKINSFLAVKNTMLDKGKIILEIGRYDRNSKKVQQVIKIFMDLSTIEVMCFQIMEDPSKNLLRNIWERNISNKNLRKQQEASGIPRENRVPEYKGERLIYSTGRESGKAVVRQLFLNKAEDRQGNEYQYNLNDPNKLPKEKLEFVFLAEMFENESNQDQHYQQNSSNFSQSKRTFVVFPFTKNEMIEFLIGTREYIRQYQQAKMTLYMLKPQLYLDLQNEYKKEHGIKETSTSIFHKENRLMVEERQEVKNNTLMFPQSTYRPTENRNIHEERYNQYGKFQPYNASNN